MHSPVELVLCKNNSPVLSTCIHASILGCLISRKFGEDHLKPCDKPKGKMLTVPGYASSNPARRANMYSSSIW